MLPSFAEVNGGVGMRLELLQLHAGLVARIQSVVLSSSWKNLLRPQLQAYWIPATPVSNSNRRDGSHD